MPIYAGALTVRGPVTDDRGLYIRARVDDPEARRMAGLSIAATVFASEVRDEDSPSAFHFVITRARIDEISLTPIPSNPRALVSVRSDLGPIDDRSSYDEVLGAVARARKALDALISAPLLRSPAPPLLSSAPPPARAEIMIEAGPPLIYGSLPTAVLKRKKTDFSRLVAQLPVGDHHDRI